MWDSIRPGQLGKGDLMKLEKNLKGIKVKPTQRGTGAASATYFEGENGRISIIEYFQGNNSFYESKFMTHKWWRHVLTIFLEKYGINLRYPSLPVVKIGGEGQMVPMELLKIAAKQRYQKKLDGQQRLRKWLYLTLMVRTWPHMTLILILASRNLSWHIFRQKLTDLLRRKTDRKYWSWCNDPSVV